MKPSKRNLARMDALNEKRSQGKPAVSKYAAKNGRGLDPSVTPIGQLGDYRQQLADHFKGHDQ